MPVRLKPATPQSQDKHSTIELLRSLSSNSMTFTDFSLTKIHFIPDHCIMLYQVPLILTALLSI